MVVADGVSTVVKVDTVTAENTRSEPGLVRRVKADGRRVYEREAKLAIVREATQPGVSLAGVALRHGLNANLLRKWVVKHRAQALAAIDAATPSLLPVVMGSASAPTTRSSQGRPRERTEIEVECVRGMARFDDGIDRAVLRALIEAMSAR